MALVDHEEWVQRTGFRGVLEEEQAADGLDFTMDPVARLEGTIVDGEGRPQEGVRVFSEPSYGSNGPSLITRHERIQKLNGYRAEATSGPDGFFSVRARDAAWRTARIHVKHAPFLSYYGDLLASESPHVVTLDRGLGLRGRVLDAAGQPAVGARVALGPYETNALTGQEVETTDEAGRFQIHGSRPVENSPYEQPYLMVKHEGSAVLVVQPVEPSRTPKAAPLTVRLEAEAPLFGKLVAQTGEPMAGMKIQAWGEREFLPGYTDGMRPTWERKARLHEVVTAEDGAFRFRGLYAGAYEVRILDPNDKRLYASEEARTSEEPLLLRYDAAKMEKVVLEGRVLGARTGEPVTEFTVIPTVDGHGVHRPFVDKQGRFRVAGLEAGSISLAVSAPGFATERVPEQTLDHGVHRFEVRLDPAALLSCRLVDEEGKPWTSGAIRVFSMDGVPLMIRMGSGSSSSSLRFASEGVTRIFGLPARSLRFQIRTGYEEREFVLDLASLPGDDPDFVHDFVIPRTPPRPAGRVELMVLFMKGMTLQQLEQALAEAALQIAAKESDDVESDDAAGEFAGLYPSESDQVLFPNQPVTIKLKEIGGEQRVEIQMERKGDEEFHVRVNGVTSTATLFRNGQGYSWEDTSPLPTVSLTLTAGPWSMRLESAGRTPIERRLQVSAPSVKAARVPATRHLVGWEQ